LDFFSTFFIFSGTFYVYGFAVSAVPRPLTSHIRHYVSFPVVVGLHFVAASVHRVAFNGRRGYITRDRSMHIQQPMSQSINQSYLFVAAQ